MEGQPISMMDYEKSVFPIGIIAMDSAKEVGGLIDKHLMGWYYKANPAAEMMKKPRNLFCLKLLVQDLTQVTLKLFSEKQ